MKKSQKLLFAVIFSIFLIANASAVTLSNPSIILNNSVTSRNIDFLNANTSATIYLNASLSSSLQNIAQLSANSINFGGSLGTISISTQSSIASGNYFGTVDYQASDGTSGNIPVFISIAQQQTQNYEVIVFPTNKVINVQQGQKKSINIQLYVPNTYQRPVTVQSVSFNPDLDVARFGDLDLGIVNPSQTLNIPITLDATNAQTGTYNTQVIIMATDSHGQVNLAPANLQIVISVGTSPVTNDTFAIRPSCSLSSLNMNINNTYSLVCTNVVANMNVAPEYSDYFEGIKGETASGVFTYTFRPIKMGNPKFEAKFLYNNAPYFQKFSQEVRIASAGGSLSGTVLGFLFTPSLSNAKKGEKIIVQLVDNKTQSLASNPQIYQNAIPLNASSDGFSFYTTFDSDVVYSLRGRATGYDDLVLSVSLTSKTVNISITPSSGDTNTMFNITTSENVSLFLDNIKISNPYFGLISKGEHEIKTIEQGYFDSVKNITVEQALSISIDSEFKSGSISIFTLSKNASWVVNYKKDSNANSEALGNGTGTSIQLKPNKVGIYEIYGDGMILGAYEIKGWDGKIAGWLWYYWVIVIVIVAVVIWALSKKSEDTEIGYGGGINYR